jgi:serine/threonine protein kinase
LVHNSVDSKKFAVKVFKDGKENEELIERSIKCISPYLIQYYKTFSNKNYKFILMEYCTYSTLQFLINLCKERELIIPEKVC